MMRGIRDKIARTMEATVYKRIFFGHQSVGENLLQGVRETTPAVQVFDDTPGMDDVGIWHARIGQNTQPLSKLRAFEQALAGDVGDWCELALMKLCYVDVTAQTDVLAFWDAYKAAMFRILSGRPKLKLLHITVPLNVTHTGWKSRVAGLLTSQPRMDDNQERIAFSRMLHEHNPGRVFDLAELESTNPEGYRCVTIRHGISIPSLCESYTDDGGHLNATGRTRISPAFLQFLEVQSRG